MWKSYKMSLALEEITKAWTNNPWLHHSGCWWSWRTGFLQHDFRLYMCSFIECEQNVSPSWLHTWWPVWRGWGRVGCRGSEGTGPRHRSVWPPLPLCSDKGPAHPPQSPYTAWRACGSRSARVRVWMWIERDRERGKKMEERTGGRKERWLQSQSFR